MSLHERGALVVAVPQTFTRKNWPFLVFLIFLGTVLAIPAWQMGNHGIALALFSIGFGAAFLGFLFERAVEFFSAGLLAVHERGLHFRQSGEHFVEWHDLERLERWTADLETFGKSLVTQMQAITRDGRTIALGYSPKVHEAVLTHSKMTPVDLGHREL